MNASPHWLISHAHLPSTNTWAMDHIEELDHGMVVYTPQQSAGRGQHGRQWLSPAGVLTCSCVVEVQAAAAAPLSLIAGLAVADTINDRAEASGSAARCQLKWPNDVIIDEAKVAGILCEGRHWRPDLHRVVVGIGCNLRPDLAALPLEGSAMPASSLQAHAINGDDPLDFIACVRDFLLQGVAMLNLGRWQALLTRIRGHDWLLGRHINIMDGPRAYQGYAAGIDDHGHLLLTQPDGGHIAVSGGRIQPSVVPQED